MSTTDAGNERGSSGRKRPLRARAYPSELGGRVQRRTRADSLAVTAPAYEDDPAILHHPADNLVADLPTVAEIVFEPELAEPPLHLARALKAAAMARARAAHIRARQLQFELKKRCDGSRDPALEPLAAIGRIPTEGLEGGRRISAEPWPRHMRHDHRL